MKFLSAGLKLQRKKEVTRKKGANERKPKDDGNY